MIQRIQSLLLLVAAGIMCYMIFAPLGWLETPELTYTVVARGVLLNGELLYPTTPTFAFSIISTLLPLVAIFFYKKRLLQMRICVFTALIIIGNYATHCFYGSLFYEELGATAFSLSWLLLLPLLALFLIILSWRRIGQDEILVRSLDRLR